MHKAIKKIELDLGGKIVSLTPEQAKNLKDALDDLFGKEVIKVIEREYIRDSYPVPVPCLPPTWPRYPIWEYQPPPYLSTTCDIAGTGDYVDRCTLTSYCPDDGTLRLTG